MDVKIHKHLEEMERLTPLDLTRRICNLLADIPVSSISLEPKQMCNCERIFTRYPLWGRTPEQYELMVSSHLEAFAHLYLAVKDCPVSCESLKNIRNSFVDYKS